VKVSTTFGREKGKRKGDGREKVTATRKRKEEKRREEKRWGREKEEKR
jgi:hypothetical protein